MSLSFQHVRTQALRLGRRRLRPCSLLAMSLTPFDATPKIPNVYKCLWKSSFGGTCGLCEDSHGSKQREPRLRLPEPYSQPGALPVLGTCRALSWGLKETGGEWSPLCSTLPF